MGLRGIGRTGVALAWLQWEVAGGGSEEVYSRIAISYRTSSSSSNLVAPAYHSVLLATGATASPFARTSAAMIIALFFDALARLVQVRALPGRVVKSRAVETLKKICVMG